VACDCHQVAGSLPASVVSPPAGPSSPPNGALHYNQTVEAAQSNMSRCVLCGVCVCMCVRGLGRCSRFGCPCLFLRWCRLCPAPLTGGMCVCDLWRVGFAPTATSSAVLMLESSLSRWSRWRTAPCSRLRQPAQRWSPRPPRYDRSPSVSATHPFVDGWLVSALSFLSCLACFMFSFCYVRLCLCSFFQPRATRCWSFGLRVKPPWVLPFEQGTGTRVECPALPSSSGSVCLPPAVTVWRRSLRASQTLRRPTRYDRSDVLFWGMCPLPHLCALTQGLCAFVCMWFRCACSVRGGGGGGGGVTWVGWLRVGVSENDRRRAIHVCTKSPRPMWAAPSRSAPWLLETTGRCRDTPPPRDRAKLCPPPLPPTTVRLPRRLPEAASLRPTNKLPRAVAWVLRTRRSECNVQQPRSLIARGWCKSLAARLLCVILARRACVRVYLCACSCAIWRGRLVLRSVGWLAVGCVVCPFL